MFMRADEALAKATANKTHSIEIHRYKFSTKIEQAIEAAIADGQVEMLVRSEPIPSLLGHEPVTPIIEELKAAGYTTKLHASGTAGSDYWFYEYKISWGPKPQKVET